VVKRPDLPEVDFAFDGYHNSSPASRSRWGRCPAAPAPRWSRPAAAPAAPDRTTGGPRFGRASSTSERASKISSRC